jgi:excinuclease ABC subunit C
MDSVFTAMDAILGEETFVDFGPDVLLPFPRQPAACVEAESQNELRDLVRGFAPTRPGVYGMVDAVGRLIYVGKSKSLRHRLLSYFMPTNEDEKAGRIVQSAFRIVWETQPSEFAALLREQHLIRTFRPRFNVQGIPNRQKSLFLCLGRGPAATFYAAGEADPKAIAWEGPLIGAGRVRRAAEVLNRAFLLRDCSNKTNFQFREQRQLFDLELRASCVRHEMQTCLGPCAQGCSRGEYRRSAEAAEEFLRGRAPDLLSRLEARMLRAAEQLHFEQAIRFREDLRVVKWLQSRLVDHARARAWLTCVYPVRGVDGRDIWYFVRRGVVEHAIRAPKNKRSESVALRAVEEWQACDNIVGTKYARREETLAIVAGWFRKKPDEQAKLMLGSSALAAEKSA